MLNQNTRTLWKLSRDQDKFFAPLTRTILTIAPRLPLNLSTVTPAEGAGWDTIETQLYSPER